MQSALRIPRVELKRKQRDIKNNPQPFAGRKCPRHRRLCARPPGPIRSGHRIEGGPGSAGCAVGPRLRRCLQVPVLGSFRRSRPRRGTALPVGFPTRNKQTKSPNPNHATCVLWSDTLNLGSNTVKKRGGGGGGGTKTKNNTPPYSGFFPPSDAKFLFVPRFQLASPRRMVFTTDIHIITAFKCYALTSEIFSLN